MQTNQPLAADLVDEDQLAAELGKHRRTIIRWRQRRVGPPFIRLGRDIRYRRQAVRDWLISLEQKQARAGGGD